MPNHYRKTECPVCHNRWMDQVNNQTEYVLKGAKIKVYLTVCPGCGEPLYISSGQEMGIAQKDIPEDGVAVAKNRF